MRIARLQPPIALCWGFLGLGTLLLSAIYRLAMRASTLLPAQLYWHHWVALALAVAFMAYSEGYKGFQLAFSPRVAARARYLKTHADFWTTVFAPFFLMGYFRSTRKRKVVVIALTTGIVLLVVLVRQLPQPWREIIDLAVVIGLAYGVLSLGVFSIRALTASHFPYSPEIPGYQDALTEQG